MTTTTMKAVQGMGIEDATMVLRRKPQNAVEYGVARIALLALAGIGMSQASIEAEAGRSLSFPEELVLAEV
jgi:hypothetical protein